MYTIKIIDMDEGKVDDTFSLDNLEDAIVTFWNTIIQVELESDLSLTINTLEKSPIILEASGFTYKAILSKDIQNG
jgi:hypothetical protein